MIAFVVSFSILLIFLTLTTDNIYYKTQDEFQNLVNNDVNEKVFLIGSSHIGPLNATFIHDYLSQNDKKYDVYNLVNTADTPKDRLKYVDMIISAKPKIVVYGIAYRDFEDPVPINMKKTPLPDPHDILAKLLGNFLSNYDFSLLEHPILITLAGVQILENQIYGHGNENGTNIAGQQFILPPNTPTVKGDQSDYAPKSDIELKNYAIEHPPTFNGISNPDNNENVKALQEIISKLQKNNIKVVIFTTPQSKYYLNAMPNSQKQIFNSILQNISNKYNLQIFSLEDKYVDLPVWRNLTHVAINSHVTIYSEDIAKIILQEIES